MMLCHLARTRCGGTYQRGMVIVAVVFDALQGLQGIPLVKILPIRVFFTGSINVHRRQPVVVVRYFLAKAVQDLVVVQAI